MLDIQAGAQPATPPNLGAVQFYNIELTPLSDGRYFVGLTATHFDEADLEFFNEDIASDRVATIDDALALISERVRTATQEAPRASTTEGSKPGWFRNFYQCPACKQHWTDEWSAQCDDDCPHCGDRHISPYTSEEVEDGSE